MKRLRLALLAVTLLATTPALAWWAIWYPARTAGEKLPRALFAETRPADAQGGQIVEVLAAPGVDPNTPLTYDPNTSTAIVDAAEVARLAAEQQTRSADLADCGDFAKGKAILDAIDADVAQAPGLTASQLTSATVQRKLWADVGKLSTLLRAAGRCLAWQAGHSPEEPP